MPDKTRNGPNFRLVGAGVFGVLLVWFWIANHDKVKVHFWVFSHEMSLSLALIISGVLGFLIGWFMGHWRGD